MKLNCWCCLSRWNGTCEMTRKEKKKCKEYYKKNNKNPKITVVSVDLGTIEINKEEQAKLIWHIRLAEKGEQYERSR